MDVREALERLHEDVRRNQDDAQTLRRSQLELEGDIAKAIRSLDIVEDKIDEINKNLGSIDSTIENLIKEKTKTFISKKINKSTSVFTGLVVATILSVWGAMWAFPPFRLAIVDIVNKGVRIDDYLAYKINMDNVIDKEDPHTPLRVAINEHVNRAFAAPGGINLKAHLVALREQDEFNEIFDKKLFDQIQNVYAKYDVFKSIVALSFPYIMNARYQKQIETYQEMYFYSNDDDVPYLFCAFSFQGSVIPEKIDFDLNNAEMLSLSYRPPRRNFDVYKRPIKLDEGGEAKWRSGVHELIMRIHPIRGANDEDLERSSLDANCFIAVIGRTDAHRLLKD